MSPRAAAAWVPPDSGATPQLPIHLPEELEVLLNHLTDHGRRLLADQLAKATNDPEPAKAATRVFKSWWYTLVARQHPGYFEAMARPSPTPAEAVYQTAAELRAELDL